METEGSQYRPSLPVIGRCRGRETRLMNPKDKIYLSKEKYEQLSKDLETLKKETRKEVAQKIEEAKSFGDLSENAEYHAARDEQASIEKQIMEIEEILKNAEVIEKRHSDHVEIGSTVTVRKAGGKEEKQYQIVSSTEADMATGKLSNESPLGAAMMGHKKGETFIFESPAGEVKYTIVDIE